MGHVHGPTKGKKMWLSLAVTLAFCAIEAVAGLFSHSLALVSDAGHNLSDALALGLAGYALQAMTKPAQGRHTYGYQRISALTALFNASTLVVIAIFIAVGAVGRFRHPQPLAGDVMIWVAAASVLMNTVIAVSLSGDAKTSLNSRAAMIHMAGDAISAAGVVVAGIIVRFTGWLYADAVVSLLIAGFIVWSALGILREANDILMEKAPRHLDPALVADAIGGIGGVHGIHDLHVWTVGEGQSFLSCHVALAEDTSLEFCSKVLSDVTALLNRQFQISHATIQPEVIGSCAMAETDQFYCTPSFEHVHAHGSCSHHH